MEMLKKYIEKFTDLPEESWEILCNCLSNEEYKRNELLLNEGQICDSIFFICSGFCKSYYNLDGKEINTAFYFENEFATNIRSLTSSSKSEYAIKACESMTVVRLDKSRLLKAYSKSIQIETFGRKVLELITAKQEEHSDSFKILTPKQRFENLVSKHPEFLQRVSLTQIASYLRISRETLSRYRAAR